jgi:hypothetical protein
MIRSPEGQQNTSWPSPPEAEWQKVAPAVALNEQSSPVPQGGGCAPPEATHAPSLTRLPVGQQYTSWPAPPEAEWQKVAPAVAPNEQSSPVPQGGSVPALDLHDPPLTLLPSGQQ